MIIWTSRKNKSLGKVEDLWTVGSKETISIGERKRRFKEKSHKLMNKELTSVGYVIGRNVAS